MTTVSYITVEQLRIELERALKPVKDNLHTVQVKTNDMYDWLVKNGMPMSNRVGDRS